MPPSSNELIRKTASLLYTHLTTSPEVNQFLNSNVMLFDSQGVDEHEHKLEYTSSFKQYERIMEKRITEISHELGYAHISFFYNAVSDIVDRDDGNVGGKERRMIDLVLAVFDYEKFVCLMRLKVKRFKVKREEEKREERKGEGKDVYDDSEDDGDGGREMFEDHDDDE